MKSGDLKVRRENAALDPANLDLRLIVARALAAEHGAPLGFHNEGDQLDWDRKAQTVLREIATVLEGSR